jgi:hypothetical protein
MPRARIIPTGVGNRGPGNDGGGRIKDKSGSYRLSFILSSGILVAVLRGSTPVANNPDVAEASNDEARQRRLFIVAPSFLGEGLPGR